MKRLFVMVTIVALLGLPLTVWAEVNDELFQPQHGKAEASVSTDRAAEEAVLTQVSLPTPPAKADAGKIDVRHATQRWNGAEYASVLAIF